MAVKAGSKRRILIVEDEPDIVHLLERHLGAAGYQTVHAGDGLAALRLFGEWEPDLVLLDLGLPGLEGASVCEGMRRARADVPILVLTARLDRGSYEEVMAAGASDFIVKPFKRPDLLAKVGELLGPSVDKPGRRFGLFR